MAAFAAWPRSLLLDSCFFVSRTSESLREAARRRDAGVVGGAEDHRVDAGRCEGVRDLRAGGDPTVAEVPDELHGVAVGIGGAG
jgi:hypothetical protein